MVPFGTSVIASSTMIPPLRRLFSTPTSRELVGLSVGTIQVFVVITMAAPLIPLMATDLGASPRTVGLILGAGSLASIPLTIPIGLIIRRVGTRVMLRAAAAVGASSCLIVFLAPTLAGLTVGVVIFDTARMVMIVAAQSHVAVLSSGGDSSLNFSRFGAAASVGQMLGPLLGGVALDTIGAANTWGLMSVVLVSAAVVVGFLIGPGKALRDGEERKPFHPRVLARVGVIAAILTAFLFIVAASARIALYPIFLRNVGYSATLVGTILSLRALISLLFRFGIAPVLRFVGGRFRAIVIFSLLFGVGVATTSLCRTPLTIGMNLLLIGVGLAVTLPLTMATVADGVSRSDRGVAISVRLAGNRTAQLIGPVLAGGIAEGFGIGIALAVVGFLLMGGSLVVALWWRGR